MAYTVPTDINFQSDAFKKHLAGAFTDQLALLNSGLMLSIPDSVVSPDEKGYTVSIPRWNVISGDSDKITDSLTTTINGITDIKDIAAWMEREKAWGSQEMVNVLTGEDPLKEVATMLGKYWAGEVHKSGVSLLTGVFATALLSTHVYDGSASAISKESILLAKKKLGDAADILKIAVMNSSPYFDALGAELIKDTAFINGVAESGSIEKLLGMFISKSDKLTATAGVYPTYLAAPGAIEYKFRNRTKSAFSNANMTTVNEGNLNIDIELARVATTGGGEDAIITRCSYLVHVPGIQFDGTVASNPSNAQLATGTTWTKVQTDDKLIPIVQLLTK